MEIRGYQKKLIDSVETSFNNCKNVLMVAPCGAGKTFVASEIIKKYNVPTWFIVHRKELLDQAKDTFEKQNANVHVFMVRTLKNQVDKLDKPKLIIIDEAHHSTSKTHSTVIKKCNCKTLGLTATPIRMSGKPLGDIYETMVDTIRSETLLKLGYLSQYDYYAPKLTVDFTKARIMAGDYSVSDIDFLMNKPKIYGDIIENYKRLAGDKKTIIYCSSLDYSKKIELLFDNEGYKCKQFDGSTPKKERDQIIEDFRNDKIQILINVDLIGEGFDVPDCDCVVLLRPTQSTALYIQQSMRCLRPKEGKRAVIIDFVGNVFRHGMPTEDRNWTLDTEYKCKNKGGEPDILIRQCKKCFKCYEGTAKICPYCGNDNGKTRLEIRKDEEIELQRITEIKKVEKKREQGQAHDFESLVALGYKRGYKNPQFWARMIMKSRRR